MGQEPWSLAGYDVQELIGYGGTAEVWRAVEESTGDVVALKRLRTGAGVAEVSALRREAAVLRTLDTPYVVRLRDVVGDGSGTVLVLDHADGGSLAALLARRGSLDPGEAVTVVAPLAEALAAAHARGLVHGDVTPSNVLFTAEGMPLLSDLGLARVIGSRRDRLHGTAEYLDPALLAGHEPSPASDVWGLAAVCHHLLAGSPPHEGGSVDEVLSAASAGARAPLGLLAPSAPRPLVEAVEAALDRDPSRRPGAAAFGATVRRAHAAAPVALHGLPAAVAGPGVRPTHAVPRHAATPATARPARRLPRWALPAAAAVVLLAVAGGGGWWLGRTAEPPSAAVLPAAGGTPSASPDAAADVQPEPDWRQVLDELDAARADAFERGDVDRLADVYAEGSEAFAADTARLRALVAEERSATGLRHDVRSVEVQEATPTSVRLLVVDTLAAHEVRAADGSVVQGVPARGERPYLVELVRTDQGWRLASITPA